MEKIGGKTCVIVNCVRRIKNLIHKKLIKVIKKLSLRKLRANELAAFFSENIGILMLF